MFQPGTSTDRRHVSSTWLDVLSEYDELVVAGPTQFAIVCLVWWWWWPGGQVTESWMTLTELRTSSTILGDLVVL